MSDQIVKPEDLKLRIMASTQAYFSMITGYVNYYGPILILILGIPGCLSNLVTFTSPQLRPN